MCVNEYKLWRVYAQAANMMLTNTRPCSAADAHAGVCVNTSGRMRAEVILNSVISKLEQARGLCSLSERLFWVYGVSNVLGSNPTLTTTFYQLI